MFVYSFSPRIGQISETSCHCYVTSTSGLPCVDDPNSSPSLLCRCTVPWCTDSLTPCPLAVLQDSHGGELNETFKDNARHFSRIFHPSKEVVGYFAFFSRSWACVGTFSRTASWAHQPCHCVLLAACCTVISGQSALRSIIYSYANLLFHPCGTVNEDSSTDYRRFMFILSILCHLGCGDAQFLK